MISAFVTAAFLGMTPCASLRADLADKLVAHLTFDNNLKDTSGKAADGTAQGSPTFEAGKLGSAVHITTSKDGTTNSYVSLGYPDALKLGSDATGDTKDVSFAFWVKVIHQADDQPFISNKNWGGGGNQGYVIATESDGMKWNWTDDSGSGRRDSPHVAKNVIDGNWHHVVVTFQRTGNGIIYVDAAQVDSTSVAPSTGTPVGSIDTDGSGLTISLGQDGTGAYTDGGSAEIDMLMDDLGIWQRVLSPAEISSIYSAGLNGKNLAEVPANVDPFILTSTPANSATDVQPNVAITATIQNSLTAVATNSIKLYLNGTAVAAAIEAAGTNTLVSYTPPSLLPSKSSNTVRLEFANNATPPLSKTNSFQFTVVGYTNIVLPTPLFLETFDEVAEGTLPTGWTVVNHTDDGNPGEDLNDPKSDSYKNWVVISRQRVIDIGNAGNWNSNDRLAVRPGQVVNGQVVTNLINGNFIYAESDTRSGSQVQYLFSPTYDLTGKSNIWTSYHSIYTQNQDNIGAVEYSIDGGTNWLPIVYMLDDQNQTADVVRLADGTVDAVATLTNPASDTASYTDPNTGEQIGGTYGAFIGAPISQSLAPYISGRINDDQIESKRVEFFPLPAAANQKKVSFRFAQAGTGSWFFGIDDFGIYSLASAAVTGPQLSIQRNGTQITVTWPNDAAGFTLQGTASLIAPSWSPVPGAVNNSVTLSTTGAAQFYRLSKP
jgi:hypothetical protein